MQRLNDAGNIPDQIAGNAVGGQIQHRRRIDYGVKAHDAVLRVQHMGYAGGNELGLVGRDGVLNAAVVALRLPVRLKGDEVQVADAQLVEHLDHLVRTVRRVVDQQNVRTRRNGENAVEISLPDASRHEHNILK